MQLVNVVTDIMQNLALSMLFAKMYFKLNIYFFKFSLFWYNNQSNT